MASATIRYDTPVCHQCSSLFPKRLRGPSKFCSKECWTESERQKRIAKRRAAGARVEGDLQPCVTCGAPVQIKRGQTKYCDPCRVVADNEKAKRWREANPAKVKASHQLADERKKQSPKWREWRRNYVRIQSQKRQETPRGSLDHRMSQLVRNALRGVKNGRSWETLVGYDINDLMRHLERQFVRGMGWHNIGKWHVDHIVPKSTFAYSSPEDDEFKACWALTNLRPLWAEENLKKSAQRTHLI